MCVCRGGTTVAAVEVASTFRVSIQENDQTGAIVAGTVEPSSLTCDQ